MGEKAHNKINRQCSNVLFKWEWNANLIEIEIEIEIEKYFIHSPVGEIQISWVTQKIINIYNDFILNNNNNNNNDNNNQWRNK